MASPSRPMPTTVSLPFQGASATVGAPQQRSVEIEQEHRYPRSVADQVAAGLLRVVSDGIEEVSKSVLQDQLLDMPRAVRALMSVPPLGLLLR